MELYPNDAIGWTRKGNVLEKLNSYQEALLAYEKSIELDPNNAIPWINKATSLQGLHRFSEIQGCLLRAYHLNINILEICSGYFTLFEKHCDAPLFIQRLFTEYPQLQTSLTWTTLRQKAFRTSSEMFKIINFVNSEYCHFDRLEKKKLEGVIKYCMGDPIEAGKVFNEVDDINEMDLMGQYYIIVSLDAYNDNTTGESVCALENAQKYLENGGNEDVQLYYAGYILFMNEKFEDAAQCFKKSNEFLPSLYMELLTAHASENIDDINTIAELIIDKEYKIMLDGRKGYLQGISPYEIDINEQGWNKPIEKYAHYLEISESFYLVYEWLEKYEKDNNKTHPIRKYLDYSLQREPKKSFDIWILKEQCITQLEQYAKEVTQNDLEHAEIILKNKFTAFPFQDSSSNNLEREIAVFVEKEDFTGETKEHQILVEYYHCRNMLSTESAMLLSFYISYKEIHSIHKASNKDIYLTAAAASAVSCILGLSVSAGQAVTVTLTSGGAVLGTILGNYLGTLFHGKTKPLNNYKTFKSNFIEFAVEIKDKKGEQFTIHDIDQLINDISD